MKSFLPLLSAFVVVNFSNAETITITTNQGKITGEERRARNGDAFTAFLGVPYAQPPVGELRWRPPRPLDSWGQTVRDGTVDGDECWQNEIEHPDKTLGSEDCLFLNVFTRHPGDAGAKRPVLVWIHGGAFIFGGAKLYNPEYLMEEDVVVVAVQYRLNIFGFLSNEDKELPGNYGMKDQQEALRWAHKNIAAYGGDPKQISLFGMSAGGASVHYHMLSPDSKGLFNSAISFSGSALNWWASIPDPSKQARKLAKEMRCEKTGGHMVDCLRQKDASDLMAAHAAFFDWLPATPAREPMNVFSPTFDPWAEEPLLPEHPIEAMERGHIHEVPYMLGYAEKEGNWRINYVSPDGPKGFEIWGEFLQKTDDLLPLATGIFGSNSKDQKGLLRKLQEYYGLKSLANPPTNKQISRLSDLSGDTMFNYGIDVTAKLHAKNGKAPTYFEHITYPFKHSLANFRSDHTFGPPPLEALKSASHGTDMLMMWKMFPMGELSDEDLAVSRKFNKMAIDFLVNGRPTLNPDWKPLKEGVYNHLLIDREFRVEPGLPFQDRIDFWRTLDVYWNATLPGRGSSARDEL